MASAQTGISSGSAGKAGYSTQGAEREQVIPLPEEELKVGKRATETVKHIRTYVVEEPVQKDVQLRDERTTIERRPATGAVAGQPAEREYEVREIHEEPIVRRMYGLANWWYGKRRRSVLNELPTRLRRRRRTSIKPGDNGSSSGVFNGYDGGERSQFALKESSCEATF